MTPTFQMWKWRHWEGIQLAQRHTTNKWWRKEKWKWVVTPVFCCGNWAPGGKDTGTRILSTQQWATWSIPKGLHWSKSRPHPIPQGLEGTLLLQGAAERVLVAFAKVCPTLCPFAESLARKWLIAVPQAGLFLSEPISAFEWAQQDHTFTFFSKGRNEDLNSKPIITGW